MNEWTLKKEILEDTSFSLTPRSLGKLWLSIQQRKHLGIDNIECVWISRRDPQLFCLTSVFRSGVGWIKISYPHRSWIYYNLLQILFTCIYLTQNLLNFDGDIRKSNNNLHFSEWVRCWFINRSGVRLPYKDISRWLTTIVHCCGNEQASYNCFLNTVASPSFEPD